MRLLFMGSPEFAIPSLALLVQHYDIAAVVTTPDSPAGRGQKPSSPPVKAFAVKHGVKVLQPVSLKESSFLGELQEISADLMVVVAFRILPREVFILPRFGAFNLHASLLPKYRGAAPINWAIIKGEKETGVTTFFLQETVDTGNIILQARLPIGPDETAGELYERLAALGSEIVLHTVRLIEQGKASPRTQDHTLSSPAPKIFTEDCRIDWNRPARQVHDFVRGLSPRPGAWSHLGDALLKVLRTRVAPPSPSMSPGAMYTVGRTLMVATAGGGAVELLELQLEGKKKLSGEEFLRGKPVQPGTILR